jgi:hypothetical protein
MEKKLQKGIPPVHFFFFLGMMIGWAGNDVRLTSLAPAGTRTPVRSPTIAYFFSCPTPSLFSFLFFLPFFPLFAPVQICPSWFKMCCLLYVEWMDQGNISNIRIILYFFVRQGCWKPKTISEKSRVRFSSQQGLPTRNSRKILSLSDELKIFLDQVANCWMLFYDYQVKIWRHFRTSYPVVFLLNLVTQSSQMDSF